MMLFFLTFVSCDIASLPEYWANSNQYPVIDSLEPNILEHRSGGQEIRISGQKLQDVQTVVVDSRNATIVSSSDTEIIIQVPSLVGGSEYLDVSVVTKQGFARSENSLLVTSYGANQWQKEKGSISIVSLDCPVEAYGSYDSDYYPLFWCGLEMGYSFASGFFGTSYQSGFSGDISGMTPLSALPELGISQYYDVNKPLVPPVRYDAFQIGDKISITAKRDFLKDAELIEERMQLFEENYYWTEYVTDIYGTIAVFDEQECFLQQVSDPTYQMDGIVELDDIIANNENVSIWMGFGAIEDYEGDVYEYEGYISSAVFSDNTEQSVGVVLDYSDYSGTFEGFGVAGVLGAREIHDQTSYQVQLTKMGKESALGNVNIGSYFDLTWPYLIGGQEQMSKEYGYIFEWSVDDLNMETEIPSIVVAEFRIYDMDVSDPNGWFEVGRLVKGVEYSKGNLEFLPDELSELPLVANAIDDEYEFIGLWGEISVSRHQFFRIPYEEDEIVIDFVEVIQSPVDLVE